jgi:MYXO-CTERM domain-containing protein
VRYEEADGDTKFTDDLSIGVPVSESEGGGPPLVPIAVGAVVVLALVGYAVVRRA